MKVECTNCGGNFDDKDTDYCFWCDAEQEEESEFDYIDYDEGYYK